MSVILTNGTFEVSEMTLTLEKAKWLWDEMNKSRTLWNDFTRGDFDSWYATVVSADSFWLEVRDSGKLVGVMYWTDMMQIWDVQVHGMFFDRNLVGKVELCLATSKWFFDAFPGCHRMTAVIPSIFHFTTRLLVKVGFRREGCKRQSLLMGGKKVDQLIFGLLSSEVYNGK